MSRETLSLNDEMRSYYLDTALREPAILGELREFTAQHKQAKMQLSPEQGALLIFLLRLIKAQKYLEVGTFTGYSSIAAALAMGPTGRVIACDLVEEFTKIAQQWWKKAGVESQITLKLQAAVFSLETLVAEGHSGTFDCMLIDADKPYYPTYYDFALQLVRPGGLIILDNMFLGGRVANPKPNHPASVKILHEFNRQLRDDPRVEHAMLPAGDGMTLLFKRESI